MSSNLYNGSKTAKQGFQNEQEVADSFNNWVFDERSRQWLIIMGYDLSEIEVVRAEVISGYKTDVHIQVTIKVTNLIDTQNVQVKLVSTKKGFNQIDKRWVDSYADMWNIPSDIVSILKRYSGEYKPNILNSKDKRRMFMTEFSIDEQTALLEWLNQNKTLIVSDVLRGRGSFAAEWILVIQKGLQNTKWVLKPINLCLNAYGNGEIKITNRGSINIGKITLQRKGGDGGKVTANMLQFKIDPTILFEYDRDRK